MSSLNWTPKQIMLLGNFCDGDVAKWLGRSRSSIIKKRKELGVSSYYDSAARSESRAGAWNKYRDVKWNHIDWRKSNSKIAHEMGRTAAHVARVRLLKFGTKWRRLNWTGVNWKMIDAEIARQLDCSRERVGQMRQEIFGGRTREIRPFGGDKCVRHTT